MNPVVWTILLALTGCEATKDADTGAGNAASDGIEDTGTAGAVTPEPEPDPIALSLTLPLPAVLDPKLPGATAVSVAWALGGAEDCAATLTIDNGIGQRRTLDPAALEAEWDGRDDAGAFFDTGTATVALAAACADGREAVETGTLTVVRLGPASIDLHGDEDDGAVALAFHKRSLFETAVSPVGDRAEYRQNPAGALGSALDTDDGLPRAPVPLWADPDVPPWADGEVSQHNVPGAFVAETGMAVTVQMGETAVSMARSVAIGAWGPTPDAVPPIRTVLNGDPVDAAMGPGTTATVPIGPAPATMGRHIQTLAWSWEALGTDGAWHPIPGAIETQHVVYTLAGSPALLDGTDVGKAPAIPWIGVLENTASILEGVPANASDVLTALRNHLFEHDYIVYDPGTGAYTDFEGPYMYWDNITAQLSPFLDRGAGLSLYCHSMSCMLSALAGNHGVFAEQLVLGINFNTNHTRAAGTTEWRRWSFNSHSVVSPDDGGTIWDSSVALDGDDDPYEEPIDEIMPVAMDGDEYMWRLTYDDIEIINQGLCYIE